MVKDPNHQWNDGETIFAPLQVCGCQITQELFSLCRRGRDLKKSADGWYNLYQSQKDTPVDATIIRAHLTNFETHRKAYLKHLETGKDWAL